MDQLPDLGAACVSGVGPLAAVSGWADGEPGGGLRRGGGLPAPTGPPLPLASTPPPGFITPHGEPGGLLGPPATVASFAGVAGSVSPVGLVSSDPGVMPCSASNSWSTASRLYRRR